jgi:hypothetical protein
LQQKLFEPNYNIKDIVYTPDRVAKDMIDFCKPSGRILDPCKGKGVFLKYLSAGTNYCEITEGKDFFDYNDKVDWIISNPPYSGFFPWIYHSMTIADNIVYLLPANKPFISNRLLMLLKDWGEIKHLRLYGTGNKLGFPVGFAIGAFYFKRGYKDGMTFSYYNWA